jgi:ubiquinone/menaquinone biosynthesis C-methylase UbiE
MTQAISYLMDDPREAKRLAAKVNPTEWIDKYFAPYLCSARRVLDIGCGPGVIAAEIASRYANLEIVGIDFSAERIQEAKNHFAHLPNARAQRAEASALPFADDDFELIYCRFLLEYLPDPVAAIGEMVRVCKPCGTVLLQDLDGQLLWHYPQDDELERDLQAVVEALSKTGFDPFVGRKLFSYAKAVGLVDVKVRTDSYHLIAGKIDADNFKLWELKLDIALPAAAKVLGSQQAAQALKQRFLQYLLREDSLTYSVVFTVVGTKSE